MRGVLQPVLVRPLPGGRYELIAGERRWRAAELAELETIPAIVRHHDDAASLEVALIENMAREDLNPVEEARACAALVEELGLTREEVGRRVGRSRVAVSNLIRLLDLPDEALELLERGDLSEGHGRALLLADDHAERRRLARAAVAGRLVGARARAPCPQRRRRDGSAQAQRRPPHPPAASPRPGGRVDQIADGFAAALGREVAGRSAEGARATASSSRCESLDDALELARCRALRDRAPPASAS